MLGESFTGRRYLGLVLILGSLSAIGPLTIDTYLPALPTLTRQLGATDAQAQLTLTGLLLGLGLGQLIVGPLSDTFGRKRPLMIGLVAHASMSVLCGLAPTIEILTVTRVLQGLAGAAITVVGMAMVRDLFTGLRAAQLLSRLILVLGVAPILRAEPGECPAQGHLVARDLRGHRGGRVDHARHRLAQATRDPAAGAAARGLGPRNRTGVRRCPA